MKKIKLTTDLDERETFKKWNGKFLDKSSYSKVYRIKEDTGIMKPTNSLDGSDVPLAYIITNAYPDDRVRNVLASIEDTTKMRANCSGPIEPEDMAKKGLKIHENYRLRSPNSYQVKTKSGKWGMIAYANEIHSVMIGFKRGRFTGDIGPSGWVDDNPEKWSVLQDISLWNEKAFLNANPTIYNKQRKFAEESIEPEYRVGGGSFTTLSANRYSTGGSERMSAHIDSGDLKFGMTTMCVFREGNYDGAFLVFPRYGIAIDAPDNSVVIADSRQVHGVTPITGNGTRFSCVAYCDNRLATEGAAGKGIKLIGKADKKRGNLEDFLK